MNNKTLNDIPEYVYKFIRIFSYKLLNSGYFPTYEREDIEQELLLFFIEKLTHKKQRNEPKFVFTALQNASLNMLKHRKALKRGFFYTQSLDTLEDSGIPIPDGSVTIENFERNIIFKEISKFLKPKEKQIFELLIKGTKMADIANICHVSYSTILKVTEKMKKILHEE